MLDTALVLALRDAVTAVRVELAAQVRRLADLADAHRATPMVARTLTQHAVPTTFGLKAAGWLTGVLDAGDDLARAGAGRCRSAAPPAPWPPPSSSPADRADPVQIALDLASGVAGRLGLSPAAPWHTTRATLTRAGDALVRATDAWGHLANDVLRAVPPRDRRARRRAAAAAPRPCRTRRTRSSPCSSAGPP